MNELTKRELTNQKLISAVSRGFRRNGYMGIGVDGLSKYANVTSGAFYAHLGSKSKAFKVSLEVGLQEVIDAIPQFQQEHGAQWTAEFSRFYLSLDHSLDLEEGCALATLTIDVVRSPEFQDRAYQKSILKIIELISQGLSGSDEDNKKQRAWGYLSIMVGGLNFIRAMADKKTKKIMSESLAISACKVAGRAKK